MLRLVCCLALIAGGSGLGYALCRRYQARVRQLEACDQFLSRLQAYLRAERLTTRELFEKTAQIESLQELAFVRETAESLQTEINFPRVWRESLKKGGPALALIADDLRVLEGIAEVIGSCDAQSQAEALELTRELLQKNGEQAREQSRTNGKLSCSLGMLGGIALAILLV